MKNKQKPSFIKKSFRFLIFTSLFFISCILIFLTCAFIFSRITIEGNKEKNSIHTVFLMKSGIHVDFLLPISNEFKDWQEEFPISNTRSKDSTYKKIAIGWGSKDFYMNTPTWDDLTLKIFLISNFGLGSSAIQVKYYTDTLPKDSKITSLKLSNNQYKQLVKYIETSLKRSKTINSSFILPKNPKVLTENNSFYDAKQTYSLLLTCNTWINNGLKASGQKACLWTPDAGGIFYQYEK
jgi:uncharacterized protein (TIGR02117 family)